MPKKGKEKKRDRDEGAESAAKRRGRASEGDVAMKLGDELGEWTVIGLAGITRKGWKKKYNSKARISREEHARVVAERDELSRQVARLTAQLAAATARDVDH